MKQNGIDILKIFIADKIRQRKGELASIYNSAEEQQAQLEVLKVLEATAQAQRYAKWCSGNNEIIVLESILRKIKEIEQVKNEDENNRKR